MLKRKAIPIDLDADPTQELTSLRQLTTLEDVEWWAQVQGFSSAQDLARSVRSQPEDLIGYWVENPTPWTFPFSKTDLVAIDSHWILVQEQGEIVFPAREDITINLYRNPANFSRAYVFTSDFLSLG